MSIFGHPADPPDIKEVARDAFGDPIRVTEQTVHVSSVERDNGVKSATSQSISSALYDLADRSSLTHTVRLPHGTFVKLAPVSQPSLSSYRSKFEITNGEDTPKIATGTSAAADLAKEVDILAMSKKDKATIQQMSEEEEPLQEIDIHISGYVTKSGKHVGAYSQIRKKIEGLGGGSSLHLPDGITVSKRGKWFNVGIGHGSVGGNLGSADAATKQALNHSASSTHPKSIGGRVSHSPESGFFGPKEINAIPNSGDNPKLPGTPHPQDVAHRAAKARKEAVKRLPSRKQRAENERKAKERGEHDAEIQKERDILMRAGDERRKKEAKERRERDESPMPGVIRKPSESDAIRAKEGASGGKATSARPGGVSVPVPEGGGGRTNSRPAKNTSAAANIDREKRKRAKAVAGHPAAKARRRHKGLAESEQSSLLGR
jgi:hypothetical protein